MAETGSGSESEGRKRRRSTNHPSTDPISSGASSSSTTTTTTPPTTLKYVEFYAGIGGWRMSLHKAAETLGIIATLHCCAALDHSDLCTRVYRHNFTDQNQSVADPISSSSNSQNTPLKPQRIEQLTVEQVRNWNADLWMMSPPCQPHTRQHSNQGKHDKRSDSFLHLCKLLIEVKPRIILLENVVGFATSATCATYLDALNKAGEYEVANFELQPYQTGIPNDRPRFYSVAVRKLVLPESSICRSRNAFEEDPWMQPYFSTPASQADGTIRVHTSLNEIGILPEAKVDHATLPEVGNFLDDACVDEEMQRSNLRVSDIILQKPAAWCLDIVSSTDCRTSCFTSAYGKYMKGTGSVLLQKDPAAPQANAKDSTFTSSVQLKSPQDRQYDPDWTRSLTASGFHLRYFSGIELSRLFGFDSSFGFPADCTNKQQWKLVGNSLNVCVASKLVELAFRRTGIP